MWLTGRTLILGHIRWLRRGTDCHPQTFGSSHHLCFWKLSQALAFILPSPQCPGDLWVTCTQGRPASVKVIDICRRTCYIFLPLEACSHFLMDMLIPVSLSKSWTWQTQMLDRGHWLQPVCRHSSCILSHSQEKPQVFQYLLPCWSHDYHLLQFMAASFLHDINPPSVRELWFFELNTKGTVITFSYVSYINV